MVIGIGLAVAVVACTKRKDAPSAPKSTTLVADRQAAKESWLTALAADPSPLMALAESNPGWGQFFAGHVVEALEAFEKTAAKSPPDSTDRLGLALSALELAAAHRSLGQVVVELSPRLSNAQETRPGVEAAKPWLAYVAARHAQATGRAVEPHLKEIPPGSSAAVWAAALGSSATSDLAALLKAQPEGIDAEMPAEATRSYNRRLTLPALIAAGRLQEAIRLVERIDPIEDDLRFRAGEVEIGLRDPVAASARSHVYAARALAAISGGSGWFLLLKAKAELILGTPDVAERSLQKLLAATPTEAPSVLMMVEGALSPKDLEVEALGLRVQSLVLMGQLDRAKAALGRMPQETIGQRVTHAWAGSLVGRGVNRQLFDSDDGRTRLGRLLAEAVTALGETAKGTAELAALGLSDRYVDAVQRRFADAMVNDGQYAVAVKMRAAAEDKVVSHALSPRNRVFALADAALDYVRIRQPRVASKYLTRLGAILPAANEPAEMLKDLLALKAMDKADGPIEKQ